MPATIPSLWPDDIKVDLLPPLAILRTQADALARLTDGIVRADVYTTSGHEDFVVHRLELYAPLYAIRRYGILNVTHRTDYYPAVLEADCFQPKRTRDGGGKGHSLVDAVVAAQLAQAGITEAVTQALGAPEPPPWPHPDDWRPVAANQDEFLDLLAKVLKSREVRAAIDSMIALHNELYRKPNPDEAAEPAA